MGVLALMLTGKGNPILKRLRRDARHNQVKARPPRGSNSSDDGGPWWHRFAAWGATVIVAPVIAAVLIAVIKPQLDAGLKPAHLPAPPVKGSSKPAHPPGPPVKIDRVANFSSNNGFVAANIISPAQLRNDWKGINTAQDQDSTIQVSVEGNRKGIVRIVNIQVLKTCAEPLRGTYFYGPPQGSRSNLDLGFDLDEDNPSARVIRSWQIKDLSPHLGASYFFGHEYDLRQGEPLTLVLDSQTHNHSCEFRYQLDLVVNGKPTTEIIDNAGQPFRVSANLTEGFRTFSAYRALYVQSNFVNPWATQPVHWIPENPGTWHIASN